MCYLIIKKSLVVGDYETLNGYGRFDWNRDVDENHIKKIKKAILNGKVIGIVQVDARTNKIVDGQHRIEAAKELIEEGHNVKISVCIVDCGNENECKEYAKNMNANQKGWTDKNYLEFYKPTRPDYVKLEQFALNNSLCHSIPKTGKNKGLKNIKLTTAARLVLGNRFERRAIRDGLFNAVDADFSNAVEYHNELKKILEIKGYVNAERNCPNMGNSFESMITGWINFRENTWREMEKIGGFNSYCIAVRNLDMSVCTKTDEWKNRFYSILEQCKKN